MPRCCPGFKWSTLAWTLGSRRLACGPFPSYVKSCSVLGRKRADHLLLEFQAALPKMTAAPRGLIDRPWCHRPCPRESPKSVYGPEGLAAT